MFAEVSRELGARGDHKPTEVVSLEASVLEVTTENSQHLASVRYTGLVPRTATRTRGRSTRSGT